MIIMLLALVRLGKSVKNFWELHGKKNVEVYIFQEE